MSKKWHETGFKELRKVVLSALKEERLNFCAEIEILANQMDYDPHCDRFFSVPIKRYIKRIRKWKSAILILDGKVHDNFDSEGDTDD